jgi:hypothetical protein
MIGLGWGRRHSSVTRSILLFARSIVITAMKDGPLAVEYRAGVRFARAFESTEHWAYHQRLEGVVCSWLFTLVFRGALCCETQKGSQIF